MKTAPVKRHVVTIKRPASSGTPNLGPRGQVIGNDKTIAENVPCSIENLSGRELELARQVVSDATKRVRLFDDPDWGLNSKDYLIFGSRRLNIGYVDHPEEVQVEAFLLCKEAA